MMGAKKVIDSLKNSIAFESFGVKIRIYCARQDILQEIEARIGRILPKGLYRKISPRRAVHTISVRKNKSFDFVLFEGRKKITGGNKRDVFLKYLDWRIRLKIAEYAVSRVFLHAGVVGWKGKAIIIPAKSFGGKTTLVRELTKLGARYYSDEYAVLDDRGYVHPFPKMLSIRSDEYRQTDYPVEALGGVKGIEPLPVGMILLTEFEPGAEWQPEMLSEGVGMLEMLPHTIPIRYNPEFTMKVLNKTINRAIIVKTKRGEASDFVVEMLSFFEKNAF